MAYHRPLWLLALASATSCAVVEDLPEEEELVQEAGIPCQDELSCGRRNSPEVDNMGVDSLNVGGLESKNRFVILHVLKGTTKYTPKVINANFYATDLAGNTISGAGLVGAELRLLNKGNGAEYALVFRGHHDVPYWFQNAPNTNRKTKSYLIEWKVIKKPGGGGGVYEWKNVCKNPYPDGTTLTLGQPGAEVSLTEIDEVNAGLKRVLPAASPSSDWFRINCAGTNYAKLHLMGHSQASANQTAAEAGPYLSTYPQRTAGSRMLAAAYCGDLWPFPYTEEGTPLDFAPVWRPQPAGLVEAYWNESGAMCVNQTRAERHFLPELKAVVPDVRADLMQKCPQRMNPCPATPPAGALWVSIHR